MDLIYGRRIFSVAVLLVPLSVAVIVTGFCPPPNLAVRVWITKVAELAPAGTVTVVGTVAFCVSLLRRVRDTPPAGAAPLKVTVPIEFAGAVTVVGLTLKLVKTTWGWIVTVALAVFDSGDWLPAASIAATA